MKYSIYCVENFHTPFHTIPHFSTRCGIVFVLLCVDIQQFGDFTDLLAQNLFFNQ